MKRTIALLFGCSTLLILTNCGGIVGGGSTGGSAGTSSAVPLFWAKSYGDLTHEWATDVQQTGDGGYVVAGQKNGDPWLFRLSEDGSLDWQKSYEFEGTFGAGGVGLYSTMQVTSDGGTIMADRFSTHNGGLAGTWVMKLSETGGVEWGKQYGDALNQVYMVRQTSDGGFVLCGSFGEGATLRDAWILKLNSDGSIDWQKRLEGEGHDEARSILQTSDGGFVVVGRTYSAQPPYPPNWVIRLDATGNPVWQKEYEMGLSQRVTEAPGGGFLVACATEAAAFSPYQLSLVRFLADGTIAWQKKYEDGITLYPSSVVAGPDGSFLVGGQRGTFIDGSSDNFVLRVDGAGDIEWYRTFGGQWGESTGTLRVTEDGGCVMVSGTVSFGAGNTDAWVLKLKPDGTLPPLHVDGVLTATDTAYVFTDTSAAAVDTFAPVVDLAPITVTNTTAVEMQQVP